MNAKSDVVEPVPGEVIGRSILKSVGYILLLLVLFCFGVLLVWAWWTEATFERFGVPHQVNWWGFTIGLGCVLSSPLLIAHTIHRLLTRERLILGKDRLQLLRRLRGKDVVVLQIPYRNIAHISYEATKTEWVLGVDLLDTDDPETFGDSFQTNKMWHGWDYIVGDGYRVKAAKLYKKLRQLAGLAD